MKKFVSFFILLLASFCLSAQEVDINGCDIVSFTDFETHSFEAYGNVFVETNPIEPVDMYVKIVDTPEHATYKVYRTTDTPQKCGEWRFVTDRSKARFTIRYVKSDWFYDCTIYFVKDRSKAGF